MKKNIAIGLLIFYGATMTLFALVQRTEAVKNFMEAERQRRFAEDQNQKARVVQVDAEYHVYL